MSATGALLARDKIDRYRSFGAYGKPAYQSHVQLRAMLATKRGARCADYFAKPTYDPDLGKLRWTAELPGTARAWHTLGPEAQAQYTLNLALIRSGLMAFVREQRGQGAVAPGGSAAFATPMPLPAGPRKRPWWWLLWGLLPALLPALLPPLLAALLAWLWLRQGQRVEDCRGGLKAPTDGKKLYVERLDCNAADQPGLGLAGGKHEDQVAKRRPHNVLRHQQRRRALGGALAAPSVISS